MDRSNRRNRIVDLAILVVLAILLFNPSGFLVRRATAAYGEWKERRRVASVWDELASVPSRLGDLTSNAAHSPIVEFMDYTCSVCQALAPTVLEATRTQGVVIVVRHVPSERGGPGATEAAFAAICAEGYGLFPEVHAALLSEQTWLQDRDWIGLAESVGIEDSESFHRCLGEEATRRRLERDVALADVLGIFGTPTFVSDRTVHPGASGLGLAIADNAQLRLLEQDVGTTLRVPSQVTFDSSEHPDLAELSVITAGFFLPDTRLVLVEHTEVLFVDAISGETRIFGREGAGPQEFRRIARARRGPQGIALWDILRRRVLLLDHTGEFQRAQRHHTVPFQNPMTVTLAAVHPDGRIVYRDPESRSLRTYRGRTWDSVEYVAVDDEGGLEVVAAAKGREMFYGDRNSGGVVLGHQTLHAATEDHFVIAETDREAILVFDWSGKETIRIPMPPAVRPSTVQARMAREKTAAAPMEIAEAARKSGRRMGNIDDVSPIAMEGWAENEVAPPIDALLTDFDDRLWVRDYRFADQDSVTWRVWDIERGRPLFRTRLAANERLLDARGDSVLLRRVDELDVPRAIVSRLRSAPGRVVDPIPAK